VDEEARMSTIDLAVPPWPSEPDADASARARMTWYAAVARWAPSKHNSQPWRFVVHDDALEVWADPLRSLPKTDPNRRELILSCGVAVQFVCVAARALGQIPLVQLMPAGGGGLLARVVEGGRRAVTEDDRALRAAIARRRTDRGPLDATTLDPGLAFMLQHEASEQGATLRLVASAGDRSSLARLVERADRLIAQRGDADAELAPWLRDEGDRRPDGVPADHTRGPGASQRAEFVQRDFSTARSRPAQARPGPDRPIVAVLCSHDDRPTDWLQAGRALGAVLLRAAAAGASASYLNQPVEETAIRAELRDDLRLPGPAQVVLRLGAGGIVPRTPRRTVDDVTFSADIDLTDRPAVRLTGEEAPRG
jgi:nitroreductase